MKSVVMPIIPPLELCRQIPKGEFEDTALVWARQWRIHQYTGVYFGDDVFLPLPRCKVQVISADDPSEIAKIIAGGILIPCIEAFPAPTLSEILGQFPNFHLMKWGGRNVPCTIQMKLDPETFSPEFENENPAAAALRLWLDSYQKTRPDAPTTPRAGEGDQNRP